MHKKSFTLIFCLLLLTVSSVIHTQANTFDCNNVTEIPTSECEVLIIIYHTMDSGHWHHTNWLTNNQPCTWRGLTCTNGHITSFVFGFWPFTGERLSGEIPPQLSQLTQLKELALAGGSITGTIPAELGDLSQLEFLELYLNKISGPLPPN